MPAEPRPFFFIVNPRAGTGIAVFSGVAARLRKLGAPFFAAATTGPGDARRLAELGRRGRVRAIVCVGGDGTVHEVVNGLLTAEGGIDARVPLGIVPRGTAQDFARGLGLPLSPKAAVDRLLEGEETRVDAGRIQFADGTRRVFVNVLGVGFDAEVAGRAREVRPAVTSLPAHLIGFASALAVYRNKELAISLDGDTATTYRARCNMVAVANGPYYANGMRLAPDARLDDGLLDVVVIGDIDKLNLLLNLPRAFSGSHLVRNEVSLHRVRRLTLDSPDGALVQADGEVVGQLPAEVDVLPAALRVIR